MSTPDPRAPTAATPRLRLLWRLLSALPLPFVLALALMQLGWLGASVPAAPPSAGSAATLGLLLGFSLLFGAFLWAPGRGLRVAGYAGYTIALSLDAGAATILGVLAWQGGLAGEPPASPTLVAWLAASFLAMLVGIVVVMAAFVSDLRGPGSAGR